MNLSPAWVQYLREGGWEATHWSDVGDSRATDREIMGWAAEHAFTVFTHDLDFGTVLALSHSRGPSVIQFRARNVLPNHLGEAVVAALTQHESDLLAGALVVVDEGRSRIRVLPL